MIDFLKKGTFGVNLLFFNVQTEWERNIANRIKYSFAQVDHPINVYISSTGNRYLLQFCNKLKEEIDKTRIAHTYVADTVKAGTLCVKDTNKTELASADVCIAIIDNNTGVSKEFLQYEYPYIKQNGIRTFFYFCSEKNQIETAFQKQLKIDGMNYQNIILAEELIDAGLRNLVNDITKIYTLYCNKNMIINDIADEIREIDVTTESMTLDKIPKPMITNINRCCQYFASLIEDRFKYSNLEDLKSSELDLACYNFLPILFEGEPIIRFNTGLLLDLLEKTQSKKINKIVRMRWKAIENYFKGDLDECYKYLIKAEKRAKEQGVANWIYQDILIDERNIKAKIDESKNTWSCSDAQEKIESNKEELYYPIIDRLNSSLNDEYMKGFYEDLVTSPSTVRYGSNFEKCIKLIASTYVLAMYNGSLSHLVMMIDRVRTMLFYLSTKYSDWRYKKNFYKYAVYKGKIKEINEIENKYPEILNNIDYEVALEVMRFSEISPIKHEDFNHRLIALGTVGYYLDDKKFEFYKSELLKEIFEWIDNDNRVIQNGYSIFDFLTRLQHRLTHEETACICLACLNKSMYRFIDNIFKVITNININKLSIQTRKNLINKMIMLINDEHIKYTTSSRLNAYIIMRIQNLEETNELHRILLEKLSDYEKSIYLLNTDYNANKEFDSVLDDYICKITEDNQTQGKDGKYAGKAFDYYGAIRSILADNEYICSRSLLVKIITCMHDTVINSHEIATNKESAISILLLIAVKYKDIATQYKERYEEILEYQDTEENTFGLSLVAGNVDSSIITFAQIMLSSYLGNDDYLELIREISKVKNDIATQREMLVFINEFLEINNTISLPESIEATLVQWIIISLQSNYRDLRYFSVSILIKLARKVEFRKMINDELKIIVSNDDVYIKNLIQGRMNAEGIDKATKSFIIEKFKTDSHYLVRNYFKI